MPPFRRVEADQAGPDALGILIPPGHRTLLILRPRSLAWDLLLLSPFGDHLTRAGFWELVRTEAVGLAQKVRCALEEWAGGGKGGTELVPLGEGSGYRVRVAAGPYAWLVCRRAPGKPYQPMTFASEEEARATAAGLTVVLCPGVEDDREMYFNAQHFSR